MKTRYFIIMFLLLLSFLNFQDSYSHISSLSSQILVQHDPIVINSDSDFLDYDFNGTGTQADPYMIKGYEIEATGLTARGIEITFTTLHFVITECVIYSEDTGIYLYHVLEGTSKVINNTCIGTTNWGVGIGVQYIEDCLISNNTCINFSTGIHLNSALNCEIKFNNATSNTHNGINIRYSSFIFVTYNFMKDNSQHGFAIIGASSFNFIHHNTFIDNSQESTYTIDGDRTGTINSQGYDEGDQNTWHDVNTGHGNWWTDYPGEGVYEIDGSANSIDLHPIQIEQNEETTSESSLPLIPSIMFLLISALVIIRRKIIKQ